MNLDDLTLGEIKQLRNLFGADQSPKKQHPDIGKKVIIRTYSAGVHYGTLIDKDGDHVILKDAIRIWEWAGAFTLSELATIGPKNTGDCKFAVSIPQISLVMIEIIPCSAVAIKIIESVKPYEV